MSQQKKGTIYRTATTTNYQALVSCGGKAPAYLCNDTVGIQSYYSMNIQNKLRLMKVLLVTTLSYMVIYCDSILHVSASSGHHKVYLNTKNRYI